MKTLKLNSLLFGLLAMIAVSICLTSCGKDEIATEQDTTIVSANEIGDGELGIFIPEEISKLGDEKIKEYINNLSAEQRVEQLNNFITSIFLKDKVEELGIDVNDGEIIDLSTLDIPDYLSEVEITELNSQLISLDDIENRRCRKTKICFYVGSFIDAQGNKYPIYQCVNTDIIACL